MQNAVMENTHAVAELKAADGSLRIVDLQAFAGKRLVRMPWVLRLLLENVLRCAQHDEKAPPANALLAWLENGSSDVEIPFQPGRVLMHDTTSTPALVDIAAMRDELAEAGVVPAGRETAVAVGGAGGHPP